MSTNNNHSSLSFVKNVAQHNRNFLNTNISQLNTININNSNNNMNHTSSVNSTSASSSTNNHHHHHQQPHHHHHHHHSSSSSSGKNDATSNPTPNSNIINASLPTNTNTSIVARKQAHKSISLSNSLGNNGNNNSYLYTSSNSMNNSSSQPYFPSMLKSHNQSSFSNINLSNSNKKFSIDYHNAGKFF
jgi:hypothetical protein